VSNHSHIYGFGQSHVTQHAISHMSHNMQSVTCHTICKQSHVTQHAISHTSHNMQSVTRHIANTSQTHRKHIANTSQTHRKHIANTSIHDILSTCAYTFFHLLSFFKHLKREKFNINNSHHYNLFATYSYLLRNSPSNEDSITIRCPCPWMRSQALDEVTSHPEHPSNLITHFNVFTKKLIPSFQILSYHQPLYVHVYEHEQICPAPSALILSMHPHANPFAAPLTPVPRPHAAPATKHSSAAMTSPLQSACSAPLNSLILSYSISVSQSPSY
jgi:hypothetical protein